jgi:histone deacetylase complex regulatory component SIN3
LQANQNKIWRESDSKNFAKSLDHQGINFKSNDRKAIAPKTLCTEIETLKREQYEKFITTAQPVRYQYSFKFDNKEILRDTIYLIAVCGIGIVGGSTNSSGGNGMGSYQNGNSYNADTEEEVFEMFLQGFLKEFFSITEESIVKIIRVARQQNASSQRDDEEEGDDQHEDSGVQEAGDAKELAIDSCHHLTDIELDFEYDKRKSSKEDPDVEMTDTVRDNEKDDPKKQFEIPTITTDAIPPKTPARKSWTLYGNSGYYVLFRLFEVQI